MKFFFSENCKQNCFVWPFFVWNPAEVMHNEYELDWRECKGISQICKKKSLTCTYSTSHYYNQNIVVILTNICFTILVSFMLFYFIRLQLLWKEMQKCNAIPASCSYLVASSLRPISRLSPCSSSMETLQLRGLTGRGASSSSGAGNSSTNLPRKPLHSSSIVF